MGMFSIRSSRVFLASLLRGNGWAAIGKIARYAFSPRAWKWLLSEIRAKHLLRSSGLLDETWYRREYPEVDEKGIDPAQDFLAPTHLKRRMPNPDFVPAEYAAVNFDVKASGLPWALHYAKDGMREARPVSTLDTCGAPFPPGTEELRREFPQAPAVHRRTAVFASFSGDGRISDPVLAFLRGLKDVVDNIVFIADNPVFPEEVPKLDGLVRLAVFRHHGGYDFGSYKAGWAEAKALGLLDPDICSECVVCNDSCYGPVFPFQSMFDEMERRDAARPAANRTDFWGTVFTGMYGRIAIQSFFYVFREPVLEGSHLDRWFSELIPPSDRGLVIVRCESQLTRFLCQSGYRPDALVPLSFFQSVKATPTKHPLLLMRDFRMPLLKKKCLAGDSLDDLGEVRRFVQSVNPALAAMLPVSGGGRKSPLSEARIRRESHVAALAGKVEALRQAHAAGQPVHILFLAPSGPTFQGGGLFPLCRRDGDFCPTIAVVPDGRRERFPDRLAALRETRARLFSRFPKESFVRTETDATGEWTDVSSGADIVCWETAENSSDFHYNPHYAIGRPFLPVLFFDRRTAGPYPPEKEFARQNYAYFWKIFFTDPEDFRLYAAHSLRHGDNAVCVAPGDWAPSVLRILKAAWTARPDPRISG